LIPKSLISSNRKSIKKLRSQLPLTSPSLKPCQPLNLIHQILQTACRWKICPLNKNLI
jgi:hypothetical protein